MSFLITQRSRKPSLGSEAAPGHAFEFRAALTDLDGGLETLHRSVDLLREATGRKADDRALMLFETALAEVGNNALVHGRSEDGRPVELVVLCRDGSAVAWVIDHGPPVGSTWFREMPPTTAEAGRGLALARSVLDELGYWRERGVNKWRLVKRL